MEAGCHVMVEVPTTYSIEDCWRAVVTQERTGKHFMLMEQLRFSAYIRAWRKIVDSGIIGKPLYVEGEYFGSKPDCWFQDDDGRYYTNDQAILKSYKYSNLQNPDMQVALMPTENDVILRMAVAHSTAAIRRGEMYSHWHNLFMKNGEYLNFAEFSNLVRKVEDYELFSLTKKGMGEIDTSLSVTGNFSYFSGYFENLFGDIEEMKKWYNGMCKIACNEVGDNVYFYTDNSKQADRIKKCYPYLQLIDKDKLEKLYLKP